MSTVIRSVISERNDYYIPKHRYYELKHFCLQYKDMKKMLISMDSMISRPNVTNEICKSNNFTSPVERCAINRELLMKKLEIIEKAAFLTTENKALRECILLGVTEERNYDNLKLINNIPCSKEEYYKMYHKFFWNLNWAQNKQLL